jgi:ClpP class serine protease
VWSRGQLYPDEQVKALQAREGAELDNTRETTVRDGVAVIPLYGPLMRHASVFSAISGATSYADLRKDLQVALDDPTVKAIVFDIDSPGGEVDGCGEFATSIFDARAVKPIVAYVGGTGASAAYWIASACTKIVCSKTAFLGSIGVRSMLVDDSKRTLAEGVREVDIISSKSPGKRDRPVDDEVIARAQTHVDALADVFIAAVALHRGTTPDDVAANYGSGDVLIGESAVSAKLADEIGNLETLLVELSGNAASTSSVTKTPSQGARMARSMNPALAATKTPRAEGAPPDVPKGKKKAEDGKPVEDAEGGDEEMSAVEGEPEGEDEEASEECEDDKEVSADAEDGDEDEDEDTEKKPESEDDKKKEQAAHRSLAAKLGLAPTASRREVLLAAAAIAVPSNKVAAMVDKRVAAKLAENDAKVKKAENRKRAERLAKAAISGGYDADSKDALVEYAMSNFQGASKAVAHFVANFEKLGGRTMSADADRSSGAGADTKTRRYGAVKVVKHGCSLSDAAKALAAKDNIKYEAALDRVVKENPALYQGYLNGM